MSRALQLGKRVLVVLSEQRGSWLCDRCLAEKVGDDIRGVALAIAHLYGERAIRLIRGVCFACARNDYVASVDSFHMTA